MRIGAVNAAGAQAAAGSPARTEASVAVAKFGALGTYLANLRDEDTRERYTQLSSDLKTLSNEAARLSAADLNKRYEVPDSEFTGMNSDCIKSAKELPL